MIYKTYISYLLSEIVLLDDFILKIDEGINISCNTKNYSEAFFNLTEFDTNYHDLKILNRIYDLAISGEVINEELVDIPFIKLIHFFISEHYLKKPLDYDQYKRISSKSVNEKYLKFLEVPVVDILVQLFRQKIGLEPNEKKRLIISSDFDFTNLWIKLGFPRSMKRLGLQFFTFNFNLFGKELCSFLTDKKKLENNPMLNNSLFDFEHPSVEIEKIAFWLVDRRHSQYDFRNDFSSPALKQYIESLEEWNVQFGIHPSYASAADEDLFKENMDSFKEAFNLEPVLSRYHYLKYNYPKDFILLEQNKIKADYSYCFPDSLLFRGGRTFPVRPWSFEENRLINVMSYPITIMDVVFKYYLGLNLEEAIIAAKNKLDITLKHGSTCVLLWHNNYLYKYYEKHNYQPELFEFVKNYLKEHFSRKDNF